MKPETVRERRAGLVLSVGRIWAMSLTFRLGCRPRVPGFSPGLRNLLAYELGRLWHRLYERERLAYRLGCLRSWPRRSSGR